MNVRIVDLGPNRFAQSDDGLSRANEVCMIFRRPWGDVLTFRKTFYPPGVYRLPTGGINVGEDIVDALRREVREETGLSADPHRLLATVGYCVNGFSDRHCCYTFAFLLDEVTGTPAAVDASEQVEEFRWVGVGELPRIAEMLERLRDEYSPDLESTWRDWGRFRAVIHRVVWDVMR